MEKGADANAFSRYDSSALFVATQHNRADMVKMLLEHGADPNFINEFELRDPALVVAAAQGNAEIVRLLLAHGANVNEQSKEDGETARGAAMRHHHVELLPLLQENSHSAQ